MYGRTSTTVGGRGAVWPSRKLEVGTWKHGDFWKASSRPSHGVIHTHTHTRTHRLHRRSPDCDWGKPCTSMMHSESTKGLGASSQWHSAHTQEGSNQGYLRIPCNMSSTCRSSSFASRPRGVVIRGSWLRAMPHHGFYWQLAAIYLRWRQAAKFWLSAKTQMIGSQRAPSFCNFEFVGVTAWNIRGQWIKPRPSMFDRWTESIFKKLKSSLEGL
jgi:hypothetical protein